MYENLGCVSDRATVNPFQEHPIPAIFINDADAMITGEGARLCAPTVSV
ncbi:MAG: hypothetical protein RLP02_23685 [Coleofasciculus sp. C2-GNP5-27]